MKGLHSPAHPDTRRIWTAPSVAAAMFQSIILAVLLGLSNAAASTTPTASPEEQKARVANRIVSIGFFADHGLFTKMCSVYAEQVVFDYSSLWGNEPGSMDPSGAATAWSRFLPGFDTTRHQMDVQRVTLANGSASARAAVTADHWLSGESWSITGYYDVELQEIDGDWKIHLWRFTLDTETGNRNLVYDARDIAVDLVERPIVCDAR